MIILDVDETLLAFNSVWVENYNRLFGKNLSVEDIWSWDLRDVLGDEADNFWRARTPELYEVTQPTPYARWGVETLRVAGHTLAAVTCDEPRFAVAKRDCLQRFFPNLPLIVAAEKKKVVPDAILIDDAPIFNPDILLTRPWNANVKTTALRARNWIEVVEIILNGKTYGSPYQR